MALVATPVLLITAFLTFFTSQDIDLEEGIDRHLGSSVAALRIAQSGGGFVQGWGWEADPVARVTPGYDASDGWDTGRVSATVGSPVVPVGKTLAEPDGPEAVVTGPGGPLRVLVLDGQPAGVTAPLASLRSGRWAAREGEVVVTPAGVAQGLPEAGPVSLRLEGAGQPISLTVVGVADAAYDAGTNADLVLPADGELVGVEWRWLVERDAPVLLAEAQEWASYGLIVESRQVQLDPPPGQDWRDQDARRTALYYAMVGLAVLVETVLLAGPAFAVSAARQRHSLALAGAQGAARADVRRAVVAYGLVLAVVATVSAAVVGAVLGLGGALVLARLRPGQHVAPELPWQWTTPLVLASVLAAGVAAWWPARGATRLDLMSVLRGQVVSVRVGRGWPLLGGVLALAGAACLWRALTVEPYQAMPWTLGGAVLVGLGSMLLVPSILSLVARPAAGAPLTWRLASRDALRQRSRAVPAVLAITAAVGVMAAAVTVQTSSTANQERQYTVLVPRGTVSVATTDLGVGEPADADLVPAITEAAGRVLDGATAYPLEVIVGGPGIDPVTGEPEDDHPVRSLVPGDCRAQDVTPRYEEDGQPACYAGPNLIYLATPVAALERTGGLEPQMREVLEAGGILLWDRLSGEEAMAPGRGEVLAVTAPARATGRENGVELTGPVVLTRIPVYVTTSAQMDALRVSRSLPPAAYLSDEAADALGWTGATTEALVAQDRAITPAQATALQEALQGHDVSVYLERGFVSPASDRIITLVTLGVFALVALGAVVISTALAVSEGRRDSVTMAAVGATRCTRRLLAALHAVVVGVVGVCLGLVLGLTVGGVMSWVSTSMNYSSTSYDGFLGEGGVVEVPWLGLLAVVVAVPLLAAAVAWVSVRRAPSMTRAVS